MGRGARKRWPWVVRPLWRLCLRSGVPANAVTGLAAVLGLGAGVAVGAGRFALGGWLFLFSGILDVFDGRLARAQQRASAAGAAIDSVLDRYTDAAMLMGLAWFYRGTWVLLPALAFFSAFSVRLMARLVERYSVLAEAPRARVYVLETEAKLLRDVVAYVQQRTAPGEAIAVLPYYPILHFLAQRPAPHRSTYIVWPFPEFPDRDRQKIDAMEDAANYYGTEYIGKEGLEKSYEKYLHGTTGYEEVEVSAGSDGVEEAAAAGAVMRASTPRRLASESTMN